jgi:hypothetical protein
MMHERIKELIFETDEWLESNAQSDRWEREIKFAQLIVAECASRVTSKADRWGNMTDEIINECILECATDLKRHFGVEE